MDVNFEDEGEQIYRAILPADCYWKPDGTLSSAAFKDKKGLSVDRANGRSQSECISFMKSHLSGSIAFVTVKMCHNVNALLKYLPLPDDEFHSEIHNSESIALLSKRQAKYLAHIATVVSREEGI
ncbi:hypothetical protein [Caproiciproducens sp. CPB-2]|uniref:hypothetical protein n=1 Tax=Caproiciproducens sp. CPB-2 TaxID=3030017 RepID=UPI0023DAB1E1|nr:hypothetical protein [Caproiciproducens sp. CPB-2]MDF1495231.1 hypothetical protein [Caproiciproducens sp. CPB-2]